MTSLPFVPNSGISSHTFWSRPSEPSARSCQIAEATTAFVQEKMTNRVSSPAGTSPTVSAGDHLAVDGQRPLARGQHALVDLPAGTLPQRVEGGFVDPCVRHACDASTGAALEWPGRELPLQRDAGSAHAHAEVRRARRGRRRRRVHRRAPAARARAAAAPAAALPSPARRGAARPPPPRLDRGPRPRPRRPRPPCNRARARWPAGDGRGHQRAGVGAARPSPPVVGVLGARGSRRRPRRSVAPSTVGHRTWASS